VRIWFEIILFEEILSYTDRPIKQTVKFWRISSTNDDLKIFLYIRTCSTINLQRSGYTTDRITRQTVASKAETRCFYARKQDASRVFAIVWASVRPSVRPSVTLVSCIKTVQARITKSSPWTAPRSLVYRDKVSCHWVQGFPSNEGVEEGYPP